MLKDHTNMADIPYERAKFQEKLFGFLEELGAVPGDKFEPMNVKKLPRVVPNELIEAVHDRIDELHKKHPDSYYADGFEDCLDMLGIGGTSSC